MNSILSITPPVGYHWLVDRKLVGFEPFTQLQPWYFIPPEKCFWATERWLGITEKRLLVFARRQDNDDLACFIVGLDDVVEGVALIHGWTGAGFELTYEFPNFWEWLKHVVQDVAEWASLDEG